MYVVTLALIGFEQASFVLQTTQQKVSKLVDF